MQRGQMKIKNHPQSGEAKSINVFYLNEKLYCLYHRHLEYSPYAPLTSSFKMFPSLQSETSYPLVSFSPLPHSSLSPSSPCPWQPPIRALSPWSSLLWVFHISRIIKCVTFGVQLFSPSCFGGSSRL